MLKKKHWEKKITDFKDYLLSCFYFIIKRGINRALKEVFMQSKERR